MAYRETWAEIDLDALSYNVALLKNIHQKTLIAVLKANAYGHGDVEVAYHLMKLGVRFFAVSSLDEAVHLRRNGVAGEILCMAYVAPEDLSIAKKFDISVSLYSSEWISACESVEGLKVHLKVDTGMNRLGIKDREELIEVCRKADALNFSLEGVYTHFASSDDPEQVQMKAQYQLFKDQVRALGREFKWIHAANSEASIVFDTDICNAVRIGYSMYGYSVKQIGLKPVMALYTQLISVKALKAGESVGYGANYTAEVDELIGTIGIGYADGFSRAHQGSSVVIEGRPYEIVGRICMDLCMIRLDRAYPMKTRVEVIGPNIDLEAVARHVHTIIYELITCISDRVERRYLENGKLVAHQHQRFVEVKL